jgi:beta-glucosidase
MVDTGSAPGNYMSLYELYLFGSPSTTVADPLAGTAPALIAPGQSGTVSATFTNSGNVPLPGITLSVSAPDGWASTPVTSVSGQTVPAGGSVTATWTLTAPAAATAGSYTVGFTATSSSGTFTAGAQTAVPYASVADAYNHVGIVNDGQTTTGSLDDQGNSLSAQALAAAGFTSGSTVTVSGVNFTWPGTNVPDNIVCTGQAVAVTGSGSTLGIIGAGDNGTGAGTATVLYTDGSTSQFTLSLANWWGAIPAPGTSIAVSTSYVDQGSPATQFTQPVALYYQAVAIDSSKTVAYVALPQVSSSDQIGGELALHVFAVGIGS